jgi:hypothetical protein
MTHTSVRPETFSTGAGGWDGKVVLITYAKAERRPLGRADNPYRNEAGEIQYLNALILKGIAEGQEKEITREYEAPRSLRASEDGESFVDAKTGGAGKVSRNSKLGKFFAAAEAAGIDWQTVETAEGTRFSGLVGAKVLFKAEPDNDKSGVQKIDKKGYSLFDFYPETFVQQGRGVGAPKTNGADLDAVNAFIRKVVEESPERKITRAQLIQKATTQNPGILQYVMRDEFLRKSGLNYDGTSLSI